MEATAELAYSCLTKQAFTSLAEANKARSNIQRRKSSTPITVQRCRFGGHWHLTHKAGHQRRPPYNRRTLAAVHLEATG